MGLIYRNGKRVELHSDYECDLKIARSCKRRRLHPHNSNLNSSNSNKDEILGDVKDNAYTDPDYKLFLKLLDVDDDSDCEEDDRDPDYKTFLDHLKEDGKSYIFEMKREDGKSLSIKYEREDESGNGIEKKGLRNAACNISSPERRDSGVKKDAKSEPLGHATCGTYKSSREKSGPSIFRPFFPDCKYETGSSMVDDSYAEFLSKLRRDGDSMVLVYDDIVVKYEDGDGSKTESEVLETNGAPYCDNLKFTPLKTPKSFDSSMDEDYCSCIESPGASNSSYFREKLMAVLRMPYNKKEHDDLMKAASAKKAVEKDRNLRGRLVSYQTERTSFSYLDRHRDFKKLINSTGCNRRRLNLLRGLFFYLENVCHEGSFLPWLDPACLEIIPGRN